ncbi:MAG: histidinol-phosphatase HisJ family protein [Clostridia bacterium]|nr:histidinol-phosphatase HisJ family protein [Clostridia bacterium]
MIREDLHVHTVFCDGKNTPEEMAEAALAAGLTTLGFSGHSHTPIDESYCMSREGTLRYREEIARLKEKYRRKLRILCGIEMDYFSDDDPAFYDYVIGSVHYVEAGGRFYAVDHNPEAFQKAVAEGFGGDPYALCEAYYALVGDVVRKVKADIVGHFDLVTKFQEKFPSFREDHPRYRAAWEKALVPLLASGAVFEINTGAISRGWRTAPYPAPPIREAIRAGGGRMILSSDSHARGTLLYAFDRYESLL